MTKKHGSKAELETLRAEVERLSDSIRQYNQEIARLIDLNQEYRDLYHAAIAREEGNREYVVQMLEVHNRVVRLTDILEALADTAGRMLDTRGGPVSWTAVMNFEEAVLGLRDYIKPNCGPPFIGQMDLLEELEHDS